MNREEIEDAVREASRVPRARYEIDDDFTLVHMLNAVAEIAAEKLTASAPTWELVHDVAYERVRRMPVPGGWLYQTQIDQLHAPGEYVPPGARVIGWHPPIFVPGDGGGL
jgi:hypothetical protein